MFQYITVVQFAHQVKITEDYGKCGGVKREGKKQGHKVKHKTVEMVERK